MTRLRRRYAEPDQRLDLHPHNGGSRTGSLIPVGSCLGLHQSGEARMVGVERAEFQRTASGERYPLVDSRQTLVRRFVFGELVERVASDQFEELRLVVHVVIE